MDFRCLQCHQLFFRGSISLMLAKQHDPDKQELEIKCPRCGKINLFAHQPRPTVEKATIVQ